MKTRKKISIEYIYYFSKTLIQKEISGFLPESVQQNQQEPMIHQMTREVIGRSISEILDDAEDTRTEGHEV